MALPVVYAARAVSIQGRKRPAPASSPVPLRVPVVGHGEKLLIKLLIICYAVPPITQAGPLDSTALTTTSDHGPQRGHEHC